MPNYKIDTYLKIILFISLFSIISAFFIEYILGHQPCNLCLIERIPYGLCVILITLNFLIKKNTHFIILLLILVFSFSFIISFYHFGIEQGFFEESAICGVKDASDLISKEDILNQLQNKIVNCRDVTFKIFGFSLTTINIILSFVLIITLSKIYKSYEKFKK
tara:strand:- start:6 stop:494 length:489 start_codon:yes stop_codon:yes gene_type:complete